MKQPKMPYLFAFSENELHDLHFAYKLLSITIRKFHERTSLYLLDEEVDSAPYFRLIEIERELEQREIKG